MSYKKVKTVFIFDKPKCIYMKPKGTREYVEESPNKRLSKTESPKGDSFFL